MTAKKAPKVKAGTSKEAAPKKTGRPSSFTAQMGNTICERLADGESLRAICADEGMPPQATVFRWLAVNDLFREQYARAREAQADVLADETIAIADDGRNDWMEKIGKDGEAVGWQVNGEAVARSRLRVEARKWFAAKLQPKKYGDRTTLAGDAENPLSFVMEQIAANPKSRLAVK